MRWLYVSVLLRFISDCVPCDYIRLNTKVAQSYIVYAAVEAQALALQRQRDGPLSFLPNRAANGDAVPAPNNM